jgi:hypothetical protein
MIERSVRENDGKFEQPSGINGLGLYGGHEKSPDIVSESQGSDNRPTQLPMPAAQTSLYATTLVKPGLSSCSDPAGVLD